MSISVDIEHGDVDRKTFIYILRMFLFIYLAIVMFTWSINLATAYEKLLKAVFVILLIGTSWILARHDKPNRTSFFFGFVMGGAWLVFLPWWYHSSFDYQWQGTILLSGYVILFPIASAATYSSLSGFLVACIPNKYLAGIAGLGILCLQMFINGVIWLFAGEPSFH